MAAAPIMLAPATPATPVSAIPAPAEPAGQSAGLSEKERIALLAYSFWEARGRQGGSPEDDWYRAERELRNRAGSSLRH